MIDTVLAAGPFPIVFHVGSQYAWISSLFNQFKLLYVWHFNKDSTVF